MTDDHKVLVSAGLVLGDVAALVVLRPDLSALAGNLTAPHRWVATAGADQAAVTLAGAALWCVAVWFGVGLLAAAASQAPGTLGRNAHSVSRILLPGTIQRLLAGAAGLGVLLAPVAAQAAGQAPGGGQAGTSTSAPSVPAPAWPTDPPPTGAPRTTPPPTTPQLPTTPPPTTPTLPAPAWPTSTTATNTPAAPTRPPKTPIPHRTPRPTRPRHASPPEPGGAVVVQPGDSLWRIAATQLGPGATSAQIAAAWPRWYAANHIAIGTDPNLIRPGQLLQTPAATGGAR
ncbi:MAG: hypothetical protein DLM57_10635 [Pseudonocardiales bacterium]|nr:MAG: hypothetical protein DLM57_10635 [Pseudonocardiales bacterium]